MELYIYKLKYETKEEAIADFLAKGVYVQQTNDLEELINVNSENTIAVVTDIQIVLEEATFNEEGDIVTDIVAEEGFHADVMSKKEIDFGDKQIFPKNAKHTFAGY